MYYETANIFFQNPPANDENSLDFGAGNIPHFTDAQVTFSFKKKVENVFVVLLFFTI